MNKRSLGSLIALNAALLVALVVTTLTPAPARAQIGFNQAQYMMVSGRITTRRQQAAVYIVEVNSAKMISLLYNSANNKIEWVAARDQLQDLPAGR